MKQSTALLFGLVILMTCPWTSLATGKERTDHYNEGLKAYKSGRYRDALKLFDQAKFQFDENDVNYAIVHYNLGRCVQELSLREPDQQLSCKGIQWFKAYLKLSRGNASGKSRERAQRGVAALRSLCPIDNPGFGIEGGIAPQHSGAGSHHHMPIILTSLSGLFIAGGVALQFGYGQALDERDSALAKFEAAEDITIRDQHELDVRELEVDAATLKGASWTLLGVGAIVGAVAVFAWLDSEDQHPFSFWPTEPTEPGMLAWSW